MNAQTTAILRARHGQLVVSKTEGDCFRAAMSYVLGVPNGDHMPNTHDSGWVFKWRDFLGAMGLTTSTANAKGPIWKHHLWIASVPSKNLDGSTHAIVMRGHQVEFDPSPRRRYRARMGLLGADVVLGGTWLEVADATRLGAFIEWRAIFDPQPER